MKTLLNTLLFAAMTMPAVAQRYDTAQLPAPSVRAEVGTAEDESLAKPEHATAAIRPETGSGSEAEEPFAEQVGESGRVAPQAKLHATLQGTRDEHLHLKVEASETDQKFLCLVIASLEDKMMFVPGLPALLMTDTIVASGIDIGGYAFDMGPAKLPFTVFAQAVVTDGVRIGASGVLKIEPAQ